MKKEFLCREGNETFVIKVDSLKEAEAACEMYNAVLVCELCCYDIVDDNGDIMEHECIND